MRRPTKTCTKNANAAGATIAKITTLVIGTEFIIGWFRGLSSFHAHHCS